MELCSHRSRRSRASAGSAYQENQRSAGSAASIAARFRSRTPSSAQRDEVKCNQRLHNRTDEERLCSPTHCTSDTGHCCGGIDDVSVVAYPEISVNSTQPYMSYRL
eukprot:gene17772-biopygen5122